MHRGTRDRSFGLWQALRRLPARRARPCTAPAPAARVPSIVRRGGGTIAMLTLVTACASAPPPPAEAPPPLVRAPSAAPPLAGDSATDSPSTEPAAPEPAVAAVPRSAADSARVALADRRLRVPVAGVDAARILDSFFASRGARTHNAIDIMAPRGTPVVSADDGSVLRVSENRAGGLTVYTTDPSRRLVYYYAHMDRYAAGIAAGRPIARGDTIGFVGTTGNAPRDIPHLHFQMMLMHPEGRYWAGTPVNPLPFLLAADTDTDTDTDEPDE